MLRSLRYGPLAPAALASLVATSPARSEDKSAGAFLDPAPRDQMRELSTDRPDQAESPFTVDAGHWQIELDFFNYTLDREAGVRTETLNLAPVNLKLGLTNTTDLQVIFDSYTVEKTKTSGTRARTHDWGDLTLRLKRNLWGNDRAEPAPGDTAFAAMPFVKLPLEQGDTGNHSVDAGLILPLAVELPAGFGLGLMTEFDWLADTAGNDLHLEWVNSVTVSHDLGEHLGAYLEFFSAIPEGSASDWVGQFDVGFTYAFSGDVQLDAGCNFGVTRHAPDAQPFAGLSFRY